MVTFGIGGLCLRFSNTFRVDSLYRFRKNVDKVKTDVCILKIDIRSKENNMKIQYTNDFSQKLGMGDPTTFFNPFILYENDNDDTKIIHYYIMNGLRLFIKIYSYVAHMLYARSLINNTVVPIDINKNKYFMSLNTKTTLFAWVDGNSNKNKT